jgi:anti-sigma B factor antagonist
MTFNLHSQDGTPDRVTMALHGRLDAMTFGDFDEAAAPLVAQVAEGGTLVVDLSGLDYISSAGLRSVLLAAKRIRASGGRMSLCSLNHQIAEVFDISGFSSILDIQPSYDAAVTRLSAP